MGHTNHGVHDVNVRLSRHEPHVVAGRTDARIERWYPTVVELANGKILVLGGRDMDGVGVGTPELYTPGEGWKPLTGAYS